MTSSSTVLRIMITKDMILYFSSKKMLTKKILRLFSLSLKISPSSWAVSKLKCHIFESEAFLLKQVPFCLWAISIVIIAIGIIDYIIVHLFCASNCFECFTFKKNLIYFSEQPYGIVTHFVEVNIMFWRL